MKGGGASAPKAPPLDPPLIGVPLHLIPTSFSCKLLPYKYWSFAGFFGKLGHFSWLLLPVYDPFLSMHPPTLLSSCLILAALATYSCWCTFLSLLFFSSDNLMFLLQDLLLRFPINKPFCVVDLPQRSLA